MIHPQPGTEITQRRRIVPICGYCGGPWTEEDQPHICIPGAPTEAGDE